MQHLDDGQLQEWVDRARSGLTPDEQGRIERHLAECEVCTVRLVDLTEVGDQAASLLATRTPFGDVPDFAHVSGRAASRASGIRRRRLMQGGAWAASIAIALGVGWGANEAARRGEVGLEPVPTASAESTAADAVSGGVAAAAPEGMESRTTGAPQVSPSTVARRAETAPGDGAGLGAGASSGISVGEVEAEVRASANADVVPPPRVAATEAADAPQELLPLRDVPPTPAPSATRVVLGRVTDDGGSPLSAVQVFIEGTEIGVLTDARGVFSLQLGDVSPFGVQPLTLTAQRIGYGSVSREVASGSGDTVSFDVLMTEQSLSLDEIVVTGSAGDAPGPEGRRSAGAGLGAGEVVVGSSNWVPRERAAAESVAGFVIMSVRDVAVEVYSVEPFSGVWVSLVEQKLEDGTTVRLFQSSRPIRISEGMLEEGQAMVSTTRGGMSLVILGGLSEGALEAVLDRVR